MTTNHFHLSFICMHYILFLESFLSHLSSSVFHTPANTSTKTMYRRQKKVWSGKSPHQTHSDTPRGHLWPWRTTIDYKKVLSSGVVADYLHGRFLHLPILTAIDFFPQKIFHFPISDSYDLVCFHVKFNIETLIWFSKLLKGIVSIRCFVLVFNSIW